MPSDRSWPEPVTYEEKLRHEILCLCGALEHVLRFSSINYKWPEQKAGILEQIQNARKLANEREG